MGRQTNMCAGREGQGASTDFPNGDNSALRGLGMLLGSLGELLGGCTKAIATTKSWERWL
jgi:hypothetical protein